MGRGFAVYLFIGLWLSAKGQLIDNALQNLTEHLMDSYGRGYARPVYHQSTISNVYCDIVFSELLELNTRQEYITISVFMDMTWDDEYLLWNPSDYDQVSSINLPASKIWRPDITLLENVDVDFVGLKPETRASVESNGRVTLRSPAIFSTSCKQRIRYFPFDSQLCEFKFASYAFDQDEIDLITPHNHSNSVISVLDNIEWESEKYSITKELTYRICCDEPFSTLNYRILLTRRYHFHVLYLVIPGTLLSMVFPMVFYLPPSSKQKLAFAVTNMLLFVVFQEFVTGTIPFKAYERPILGIYLQIMFVFACAAMAATALVIHVSFGEGPVQLWCANLFLGTLSRYVGKKWLYPGYSRHSQYIKRDSSSSDQSPHESHELLAKQRSHIDQTTRNILKDSTASPTIPKENHAKEFLDDHREGMEDDVNDRHIKMLLKRASSVLDFFIFKRNDLDAENEERDVRLNVCFVADRLLFYFFSLMVAVVTTWAMTHMTIGSIMDFQHLTNSIQANNSMDNMKNNN